MTSVLWPKEKREKCLDNTAFCFPLVEIHSTPSCRHCKLSCSQNNYLPHHLPNRFDPRPEKDADLKTHRMLVLESIWETLHSTRWPSSCGILAPLNGVAESRLLPWKFPPQAHSGRTQLAHPVHTAGMLRDRTGCKYLHEKILLQSSSVLGTMSH